MTKTDTMITLPDIRADQKFYKEIDRHFAMAGFRQSPVNADIIRTRTKPVPQEPVRWPPQESVMRKDTMLVSEYSVSERAKSPFLVHMFFSECMITDRLYICSNVEGNLICYDETEIDFVLRLQFLAQEFHKTFG